jgi:hypothetical protein
MVRTSGLGQAIDAPVRRFRSLAAMLGHSSVDVLKMDIEGAEYEVLTDVLGSGIPVGQILVEFHHRWREVGPVRTRQAIAALEAAGYVVVAVSSAGTEYTFVPKTQALAERSSSFPS